MPSKPRRRGGPTGREAGEAYRRALEAVRRRSKILEASLLIAILVVAAYIRLIPAIKYGLELDANDPWIAYWIAKYFVENGLFNFEGLRDVKLFWYPNGRDLLKTESIGLSWLAAATYPIGRAFGLTLRQWISLFPVYAGVAATLLSYILVRRLTGSGLAGLAAAGLMAVSPASIVRTTAGFVEKIGFSLPFILAFLILLHKGLGEGERRRRLAYSALAGAVAGLVGWMWGGIHFVIALYALLMIVDSVIRPPSREAFEAYLAAGLALVIVSSLYPAVSPIYYVRKIGVAAIAAMAYYTIIYMLYDRLGFYRPLFGLWLFTAIAVMGLIAVYNGLVPVGGRILAALGVKVPSPLVTSVQEHQPASFRSIIIQAGVPLILSLIGLSIEAYRLLRGRIEKTHTVAFRLTLYLTALLLVYMTSRMAYFMQLTGFAATVTAGLAIGSLLASPQPQVVLSRRYKKKTVAYTGSDPLKLVGSALAIMVVTASVVAYAFTSYSQVEFRAPAIDTSMLPPLVFNTPQGSKLVVPFNDAWKIALEWIRENTPEDAIIVSWWDYGYWITVNTNRRTVADGATLNETQIRILARILTGTEDEASGLLPLLGAEPNKTYIVFYDAFHVIIDERGVATILPMFSSARSPIDPTLFFVNHGRGDLIKSFQMLRIAWRIDPFNSNPFNIKYSSRYVDPEGNNYLHFPGFIGEPQENVERVRNALIYKMTIYGMENLLDKIVVGPRCGGVLDNVTATLPSVFASDAVGVLPLTPVSMDRFSLEAVAVDCIEGSVFETTVSTQASFVAVFIYKWLG